MRELIKSSLQMPTKDAIIYCLEMDSKTYSYLVVYDFFNKLHVLGFDKNKYIDICNKQILNPDFVDIFYLRQNQSMGWIVEASINEIILMMIRQEMVDKQIIAN